MFEKEKKAIAEEIIQMLGDKGFKVMSLDVERPWGGFCVIDEHQVQQFATLYFNDTVPTAISSIMSAKILFVAPRKRLSWQYHLRRNEYWKVLQGNVGVVTSESDEENELHLLKPGDQIRIDKHIRHRLVGMEAWAIVAEIWEHTVSDHPSDESDIVRIQDDFERNI